LSRGIVSQEDSKTLRIAGKELQKGLSGLLATKVPVTNAVSQNCSIILGTPGKSELIASLDLEYQLNKVGKEGFLIEQQEIDGQQHSVIAANRDIGVDRKSVV